MFASRRRGVPRRHLTATIRDIVEVLAILAAGIWGVYVFVYEQRIKPAEAPPQIVVTGSLQRGVAHDGLLPIRYSVTIRNTGQLPFYTIAMAYAATGIRNAPGGVSKDTEDGVPLVFERYAHPKITEPIYREVNLGSRSAKGSGGYDVDPGGEIPESGIFFVRTNEFDEVTLSVSVAFSKFDRVYPTRVLLNRRGDVLFASQSGDPSYDFYQVIVDRTTLR